MQVSELDVMAEPGEADKVLLAALKAHHTSLQLWLLRLGRLNSEPACSKETALSVSDLGALFREALQNIPSKVKGSSDDVMSAGGCFNNACVLCCSLYCNRPLA